MASVRATSTCSNSNTTVHRNSSNRHSCATRILVILVRILSMEAITNNSYCTVRAAEASLSAAVHSITIRRVCSSYIIAEAVEWSPKTRSTRTRVPSGILGTARGREHRMRKYHKVNNNCCDKSNWNCRTYYKEYEFSLSNWQ